MTPAEYKTLRKQVGNQAKVASLLGVTRETISHRERGHFQITTEAAIAIRALAASTPSKAPPKAAQSGAK